jgi:hypothetical protein
VVGNRQAAVGRLGMPQNDVTAALVVKFIADALKGRHGAPP